MDLEATSVTVVSASMLYCTGVAKQKCDGPIYYRIYSVFMRTVVRNPYMHCKAHLAGAATLSPSY